MLKRILAVFAALLAFAPAMATEPTPYLIDNNVVPKIVCGQWMGTGVFVGNGLIATARHVVNSGAQCMVDSAPVRIVGDVPGRDFALVKMQGNPPLRALINCGGIREGHHYLATGYAEDADRTVTQRLVGSSARSHEPGFEGLVIFRGSVTQGMSGGPIIDEDDGSLVGIINANTSDGITQALGFPLSETPLCSKAST